MKRKILVTTGSRADYGILRPVLKEISKRRKLELHLVVTGMHLSKKFGYTINEIKKDGFKISATVKMIPTEDSTFSMAKTLGDGIIQFSKVFHKLKPDINLILGDRDEMLASAIASYHMNIPNAHIHGGDTSGGIDEYNRHAITKISNIHFPGTKKSYERIIKMGENPRFVFHTGSPSIDEIADKKITSRKELEKKYSFDFMGNEILLVQHPVTTQTNQTKEQILATLNAVIKLKNRVIAIAPNSDAGNKIIFKYLKLYSKKYKFIKIFESLPRSDYLGMLKNCGVLVGNSSSGIIEASYFNIPVVNIGIRQKNREMGKNIFNVNDNFPDSIYQTILKALKRKDHAKFVNKYVYGSGNASKKIVDHLEKINLNKIIEKQISY